LGVRRHNISATATSAEAVLGATPDLGIYGYQI